MIKFGRNYTLDIQTNDKNHIIIKPPFTLEFDIIRNVLSSANTCTFRIYNLSAEHRKLIQKNIIDYDNIRSIVFMAGYGKNLSLAFTGDIQQAYSYRTGTEDITEINAFDGGFAFITSNTNRVFPAGTSELDMCKTMMKDLNGIKPGAVGQNFRGKLIRGTSKSGATSDILYEHSGGCFFIDNGRAYMLADNECLAPNGITVINADSGLLETPQQEESILRFPMLFEPKLRIAQKITLQSQTESWLNGDYRVVSLSHKGIISEAVGGEAVTVVGILAPFLGIAKGGSFGLTVVDEFGEQP